MSLIQSAQKALGQLFVMGFNGLELEPSTAAFIRDSNIGGTILFAPNYENPGQVTELTNQIQDCRTEVPLWVSVDQEGGRVQRFKRGFTRLPEASAVGATGSPKLAFELAEMMGRELKAVGINVNFCPVADIHTNPRNPVIGPRAYGSTEDDVSKMVTAMVRGQLVAGVQPVVKHFPGHGDTSTDSHFALPKVDTTLEMMKEREFKPFIKAFKSRCAMVMTAHVICTKIDPKRPATLSPLIVTDILRKQLRYTRLIFSDDMEMKAIADHFGAEEAPRLAIEAGCDMLIYRSEAKAREAYEALIKALEKGQLRPELVLEAEDRIRLHKKEVLLPYEPILVSELTSKIGTPEHQAIVDRILAGGGSPDTPITPGRHARS